MLNLKWSLSASSHKCSSLSQTDLYDVNPLPNVAVHVHTAHVRPKLQRGRVRPEERKMAVNAAASTSATRYTATIISKTVCLIFNPNSFTATPRFHSFGFVVAELW
jgi:hypothetical protein